MTAEPRIEPNPRWIRGVVAGRTVIDSRAKEYVWTHPWYPAWYIPDVDIVDRDLPGEVLAELPGHRHVPWDAVDHWYEEDVEVFVHNERVDLEIDGEPVERQAPRS